jgi:hypothetical protein
MFKPRSDCKLNASNGLYMCIDLSMLGNGTVNTFLLQLSLVADLRCRMYKSGEESVTFSNV